MLTTCSPARLKHRREFSLLIIDTDQGSIDAIRQAVLGLAVDVFIAGDPEHGLDLFRSHQPQIVIASFTQPGMSGIDLLSRILDIDASAHVILTSAFDSLESAVEAVTNGAAVLKKPICHFGLRVDIAKQLDHYKQAKDGVDRNGQLRAAIAFDGLIGRSPAIWDMFSRILRFAPYYRTVLITGDTGTGKELVARSIHKLSPAARRPYVVVNCAAIAETLFESELFGHVRGAFTGATRDKMGLVEHANGGTLFLDEIGEMSLAMQAKVLRVLQNREVQRIGALNCIKVDVQIIAATNHDLKKAVAEHRFREDLYFRLSPVEIRVPRLSERKEDLPLLERYFIDRFSESYHKRVSGIEQRARVRLARYSWPGNVRELENVIGHAVMMAAGDIIELQDLPSYLLRAPEATADGLPATHPGTSLAQVQREHIIQVLRAENGVITAAADRLGLKRTSLYAVMNRLAISREEFAPQGRGTQNNAVRQHNAASERYVSGTGAITIAKAATS